MCGIVGLIHPTKKWIPDLRAAFSQMLYADAVRGKDSTGVFRVDSGKVDWRKAACAPGPFFGIKGVDEFLGVMGDASFVVGHNRSATKGRITHTNSHPFEDGHITLVHNGTLWTHNNLPDGHKYDVDSEAITHAIRKIGIKDTVPLLHGAYSLVWYDSKKKTLNFLRNKERPMNFVYTKDDLIFFSSEAPLAEWVARRNGFDVTAIQTLPIHEVWSFPEKEKEPEKMEVDAYRLPFSSPASGVKYSKEPIAVGDYDSDDYDFNGIPWKGGVGPFTEIERKEAPPVIHNPVVAALPAPKQEAKVIEFNGLPKYPAPSIMITVGEPLLFSIGDYGEIKQQGGFVPIIGDLPFKGDQYVVKGNYSGELEKLTNTKMLWKGIVSAISNQKSKKVFIDVKNIEESDILDPFFLNDEEKELWKKHKGVKQGELEALKKIDKLAEELPKVTTEDVMKMGAEIHEQMSKPAAMPDHKKLCTKCGNLFDKSFGIQIFKTGGSRWNCFPCYKKHYGVDGAPDAMIVNKELQQNGRTIN